MHGPLVALISMSSLCHFAAGLPAGATAARQVLNVRQDMSSPLFPPEVPSCAVCQPAWSGISSCAEAAPVFSDWMNSSAEAAAEPTTDWSDLSSGMCTL
ncbi:hypothetical protein Rhopal_006909-T1 [Rhodotorula paludigena]|uniref:Secreted protein n=1 Tax=Rhodotorula paludigena TaxID=86838 RepID=A0AAV5GV94_9BASI|nr:hypothetical protein Rhopal_006909-T1 [Rhodotorula paludigena]